MKIPVFKNTATNYMIMGIRLIEGILVTRWILNHLGKENYGLWAILWSFFCYALLLDFGFGVTARKSTSVELYRTDPDRYNRTISLIFSFHMAMAVLILLGTGVASYFVPLLLNVKPDAPELSYYRACFLCFGIGSALVFPFGIFSEILIGLQRLYLRNYINAVSKLVELFGVLTVFRLGGGLISLILFTVCLMALTQLSMMFFVLRLIPGARLSFRLMPDRALFRELFHFSGHIGLISVTRLIGTRSRALLVSMFCGLGAAGSFQLGGRLPALVGQLTGPYQENVSPITALLHARRKPKLLGSILRNSMRWNSFLSIPLACGTVLFAGPLIRFLFHIDDAEAVDICRVLALSTWLWLALWATPEAYFMMADRHHFLSRFKLASCLLQIGVAVVVLPRYGVVSFVWSLLGSEILLVLAVLLPVFLIWTGIGVFALARDVLLRPFAAMLPAGIAWLAEIRYFSGTLPDFWLLVVAGATGAVLYPIASFFAVAGRIERAKITKKVYTYLGVTKS